MTPATNLKHTEGRIYCASCCALSHLLLCLAANKMQRSLNSFTNELCMIPWSLPSYSPFWNTSLQDFKEHKLSSFWAKYYCDQCGNSLCSTNLHEMLSPLYQNTLYRKRGNLSCLDLTSPELFQICLYYVCNLYFHNIKVSAIFSSQLWRNKTHICDYLYHWLQQCFNIPNARLWSWMSHNFLLGRNTDAIYLALHLIFMERKS